ncbi:hypothetical protein M885DRAFT_512537 [Pelagophyceae sp. CCMP2097]|nr:hypothetical protein M885DRAFT_512537 [Pelagophyceae sp. CCMP2097]
MQSPSAGELDCSNALAEAWSTWWDVIQQHASSDRVALYGAAEDEDAGRRPLRYRELCAFAAAVGGFRSLSPTDRVALVIPNGPSAAVAFLTLAMHCTLAPLNDALARAEFAFELDDLPAAAVIVRENAAGEAASRSAAGAGAAAAVDEAEARHIPVLTLKLTPAGGACGLFTVVDGEGVDVFRRASGVSPFKAGRGDCALVLHTSGTTKKPKIVPLSHGNLTCGALCIRATLRLHADDVCVNIMPLFHIHGLSVNVLATLVAGASVTCDRSLDPERFYSRLLGVGDLGGDSASAPANIAPAATWYSAVPTMHHGIIAAGEAEHGSACSAALRADALQPASKRRLRLGILRNCSAALLPALSTRAEQLFSSCNLAVLCTYAMTESMPISSNPRDDCRRADNALRSLRSVGRPGGPHLAILQGFEHEGKVADAAFLGDAALVGALGVPPGNEGEVCVKGGCVTFGYEVREWMCGQDPNEEAFVGGAFGPRAWLRTGDKGWVDETGHLHLSGRFKEIINRGGEKISPFQVEDAVLRHPAVENCIAFSVPHVQLGETVGVCLVLHPGRHTTLADLRDFCARDARRGGGGLAKKWAPECVVFVAAIPKGPTGKPARIKLGERLGVWAIDATKPGAVSFDVGSMDVGRLPMPAPNEPASTRDLLRASSSYSCAGSKLRPGDAAMRPEAVAADMSDDGMDSMAFFTKKAGRAAVHALDDVAPSKAERGRPSTAGLQGSLYFVGMFAILVEHAGFPESAPRSAMWAVRGVLSPSLALGLFYVLAGLSEQKALRAELAASDRHGGEADVPRRSLASRVQTLAGVFLCMVFLDLAKKFSYGSFEAVFRRCLGGCGDKGGFLGMVNAPNLTRTKHFLLSLIFAKTLGWGTEAAFGRRAALVWLPPVCFLARILCFSVLVGEMQVEAYNLSTKVGNVWPSSVVAPLAYFAWPWLMPRGIATLACHATMPAGGADAGLAKSSDVCFRSEFFSRDSATLGCSRRVPARCAKAATAMIIAVHVGTVVLVSRTLQQSSRPQRSDWATTRRDWATMCLPCVFNGGNCKPAAHFAHLLPLRIGGGEAVAFWVLRVAVLVWKETFMIALLSSWCYWCRTVDGFYAKLGAQSIFAYTFHPFFVPLAQAVIRGLGDVLPTVDAVAWLPLILLWQVFVSRVPVPWRKFTATRDAYLVASPVDVSRARGDAVIQLLHPQVGIAAVVALAVLARLLQAGGYRN